MFDLLTEVNHLPALQNLINTCLVNFPFDPLTSQLVEIMTMQWKGNMGREPVWILSQIFMKSVKFTELLMTLIDRVYSIHLIITIVPSIGKKCCCLSSIHNNNFIKICLNESMSILN